MPNEIDMLLARTEETIARLKDDLRLEERLRERLIEVRGQKSAPVPITVVAHDDGDATTKSHGGRRSSKATVAGSLFSHVIAVLQEAGKGLKAREIADHVRARGYDTSAKGGLSVAVSTILAHNRDTTFQKIAHGVYDLKSRHEAEPQGKGS